MTDQSWLQSARKVKELWRTASYIQRDVCRRVMLQPLSLDQLRRIVAILDEPRKDGE